MQIEVIIVAVIVFGIMTITGQISINQLISDNQMLFMKLKEKDWDFLVRAKSVSYTHLTLPTNREV